MAAPGGLVILLFFVVPLAVVSGEAFTGGGTAFAAIFADPIFWRGLGGTLVLGLTGWMPITRYLRAEFLKLVFSQQGQEVVIKDGYLPVSAVIAKQDVRREAAFYPVAEVPAGTTTFSAPVKRTLMSGSPPMRRCHSLPSEGGRATTVSRSSLSVLRQDRT